MKSWSHFRSHSGRNKENSKRFTNFFSPLSVFFNLLSFREYLWSKVQYLHDLQWAANPDCPLSPPGDQLLCMYMSRWRVGACVNPVLFLVLSCLPYPAAQRVFFFAPPHPSYCAPIPPISRDRERERRASTAVFGTLFVLWVVAVPIYCCPLLVYCINFFIYLFWIHYTFFFNLNYSCFLAKCWSLNGVHQFIFILPVIEESWRVKVRGMLHLKPWTGNMASFVFLHQRSTWRS